MQENKVVFVSTRKMQFKNCALKWSRDSQNSGHKFPFIFETDV